MQFWTHSKLVLQGCGTRTYWQFRVARLSNLHVFGLLPGSRRAWRESTQTRWHLYVGSLRIEPATFSLRGVSTAPQCSHKFSVKFGVRQKSKAKFAATFKSYPNKSNQKSGWKNRIGPDVMRNFPSFPWPAHCVLCCDITVENAAHLSKQRCTWTQWPAGLSHRSGIFRPTVASPEGGCQRLGRRHTCDFYQCCF